MLVEPRAVESKVNTEPVGKPSRLLYKIDANKHKRLIPDRKSTLNRCIMDVQSGKTFNKLADLGLGWTQYSAVHRKKTFTKSHSDSELLCIFFVRLTSGVLTYWSAAISHQNYPTADTSREDWRSLTFRNAHRSVRLFVIQSVWSRRQ